ncbi:MAG: acyl-CoA dehydrogenase domain-containing protein [Pseudomonadota bacterium]
MTTLFVTLAALLAISAGLWRWSARGVFLLVTGTLLIAPLFFDPGSQLRWLPWIALAVPAALATPAFRRLVAARLFGRLQAVAEELDPDSLDADSLAAMAAGRESWMRQLWSGKPDWRILLDRPRRRIRRQERDYLDGAVHELCLAVADRATPDAALSKSLWRRIRRTGLLALAVPADRGGPGLEPRARSAALLRLGARSPELASLVAAANGPGPVGALLLGGTPEQKDRWLPAFARGDEIACMVFPEHGQAADEPVGVARVVSGIDGTTEPGLEISFSASCVPLAPHATVFGVLVEVTDPGDLLASGRTGSAFCLLPRNTPKLDQDGRHPKLRGAVDSGPIMARRAVVPLTSILGGPATIGEGRTLLRRTLAQQGDTGVPALAAAASRIALATTSGLTRIRPPSRPAAVRARQASASLAAMTAAAVRLETARSALTTDDGSHIGSVPLGDLLQRATAADLRDAVEGALLAGGDCARADGPAAPLATIQDTRAATLAVARPALRDRPARQYVRAALRWHPFLGTQRAALADSDRKAGLNRFATALFEHAGQLVSNAIRALLFGITRAAPARAPSTGRQATCFRQVERLSTAFALCTDALTMAAVSEGRLCRAAAERLGTVYAELHLASQLLKMHIDAGENPNEIAVIERTVAEGLVRAQDTLYRFFDNLQTPWLGGLLRLLCFPLGRAWALPPDATDREVALRLMEPGGVRQRLLRDVVDGRNADDPIGVLEQAVARVDAAALAEIALENTLHEAVTPYNAPELVERALAAGVLTAEQADQVRAAQATVARALALPPNQDPDATGALDGPHAAAG